LFFVVFTVCGVLAARRCERRFGAVLTAAATVMISIQAALNMAVVTGIVPPKGLPLPFVSRGGTSVLALSALLGLTVRACLEKRQSQVPVEDLIPWTESNAVG
jgi:cell division protein FtsW